VAMNKYSYYLREGKHEHIGTIEANTIIEAQAKSAVILLVHPLQASKIRIKLIAKDIDVKEVKETQTKKKY